MDDCVLILNAGSSSLKFALYRRPAPDQPRGAATPSWHLDARGQIQGIGTAPRFSASDGEGRSLDSKPLHEEVRDARSALDALAGWLRTRAANARLLGVGHRVVHGGAKYDAPVVVTPPVLEDLRALTPLAPLHQPYNVGGIEAVADRLPDVPQVACFDTSFHHGKPAVAELVALPRDVCRDGVQRYGFHGLSYEYIASVLPDVAPEIADRRLIVAHLGSGASMCALDRRRSIDSTFGFTALDGLCMGTRPGTVDPGVILHLFQTLKLSASQVESILYKKSGLLGISGVSNDMRDLLTSAEPDAKLAVDYFVYRAAKEIGALAAALGGLDGIVFTAGIGENSPEIRRRICVASAWLGLDLNDDANSRNDLRISLAGSRVQAWVVPTNEELMIARHTGRLLGLL
jgi:acetate kinase